MKKYGYFSPGRINLIGEHVDNFGGHVFPVAIQLGIKADVEIRNDKQIHLKSENFKEIIIDKIEKIEEESWANYVIGMFDRMMPEPTFGLNINLKSNLPAGAGLSSSASLEVLIGTIINDLYKLDYSALDIVKIAKEVENNFIGVACGIMDQFACKMGKANTAMFLDTATLDFNYVPFELEDNVLVIANTNKKRKLVESAYNDRKNDADSALIILKEYYSINQLAELSINHLPRIKEMLNENQYKRVEHIVNEEHRTNSAKSYLSNGYMQSFGELLNGSHKSLRDLYEVSCIELDTMQEAFVNNGALGARMVGAGFGGCVLALVKKSDYSEIIDSVSKIYTEQTQLIPDFYKIKSYSGASRIYTQTKEEGESN